MKRPNILFITSDQQHWNTLGVINPKIKTPNLDRLANEGIRFERSYCSNPVCSPSRSTMITGLYPSLHHCWTIGVKLPEDVPTVGESLHANGYSTALIGKAHFQPLASEPGSESLECQPTLRDLDFWRDFKGPWYGFDHVELLRNHTDESHAGQHYALWMEEKGLTNWKDYFVDWPTDEKPKRKHSWDLPEEYHYNEFISERSIARIEACVENDQPFFVWASFPDPHPSYLCPEPWASMYDPGDMPIGHAAEDEAEKMPPQYKKALEKGPDFSPYQETKFFNHGFHSHLHDDDALRKDMACYYGMMSFTDHHIGKLLDALDRLGIADNTLILFTTDHGHYLGQHGLIAKGAYHYEDMIKTPMIARWNDEIPAGQVSSALQSQVDFAPTWLTAAGIAVPGLMQGVNQLEVWRGKEDKARDGLIVENRHQPTAIHMRTYVTDRYKITVYRNKDYGELFDLQEDPNENNNLWDSPEHAPLKSELLLKSVQLEIQREPTRMPRICHA